MKNLLSKALASLRSWLAMRRLCAAGRMADRLQRRIKQQEKRLRQHKRDLDAAQRRVESIAAQAANDLADARAMHKLYDETVDAMRAQIQILEEVTVPLLTAEHKLMMQRYDTQTAIEVRKQVAAIPDRDV